MAWHDFIAVYGLDTSLTDEEAATSTPPDEDPPADLAPCPAQYFELFTGIGGGTSTDAETPGETPGETPADITAQLQTWIDQVNLWAGTDWENWIDDTVIPVPEPEARGARGDTGGDGDQPPATIPPQLPDLIDFISLPALIQVFGPWGVVVYVGLKIVKRLLEAHLEKPGVGELVTILEKAFFFDDPEEEDINKKMKSILDRGLLKTITEDDKDKVIALLEILDQDLALVDATVDFGAFRICIKGKTIQYG